jgi:tetratricopeptide (TPR) repeat protein
MELVMDFVTGGGPMKFLGRSVIALAILFAASGSARAQQSPPSGSAIQRLIAVDQLVEEKNYDDAVTGYTALLSADPHNPQILNRLGNTYQALHRDKDARHYYDLALKANSHFAAAINNVGCLYYNEHNFPKAARQYRHAIKVDSSVASFHSNLGYAYLGEKKYKDMMVEFHKAVAIDPTIFDQHNRSGAIVMERSVENRGQFYFYLAKAYGQTGDSTRCLEYLKKARDEHFKDIMLVKTDPAFAPVRTKPEIEEFMDGLTPSPEPPGGSSAAL